MVDADMVSCCLHAFVLSVCRRSNCGNGGIRELHYRCRGRSNVREIRIATISVRMVANGAMRAIWRTHAGVCQFLEFCRHFSSLSLGTRLPLTGVKIPKITHFQPPQKKVFRVQKSPLLYRAPQGKWDFGLGTPFSGAVGNGGFLTLKPSFPDFGDFDPCKGQMRS